jgi:hypothetical protein
MADVRGGSWLKVTAYYNIAQDMIATLCHFCEPSHILLLPGLLMAGDDDLPSKC